MKKALNYTGLTKTDPILAQSLAMAGLIITILFYLRQTLFRTDHYRIIDESGRYHLYQDMDLDGIYIGYLSTKGYLFEEDDGTYTWYRANGIRYLFNQDLQCIAKSDSNGNVQTLTYNTDGLLETVTDESTGRSIGFIYNADGRIEYVTASGHKCSDGWYLGDLPV